MERLICAHSMLACNRWQWRCLHTHDRCHERVEDGGVVILIPPICRSNRRPQTSQRQRIGRVPFRIWLHHSTSAGLPKGFSDSPERVSSQLGPQIPWEAPAVPYGRLITQQTQTASIMSKVHLWVNGCLKLCQAVFAIHKLDFLPCYLQLDTSGLSQDAHPRNTC